MFSVARLMSIRYNVSATMKQLSSNVACTVEMTGDRGNQLEVDK